MNTLRTIQSLSKVGRVLSRIVFVFCIVGFCGCTVGLLFLGFGGEVFKLGSVTIHGFLEKNSGMNLPTMITAMAVGMAFCAAEAVLSNFAQVYFQNELDQGDPFTLGGARELMRLGILTLSIPLGTRIACSIAISISDHFFPELEKFSFGETSQVGLGLMMLLASLLCRYGAQIKEGMETEMKMKMEMEGEGEKTKDL